MEPVKVIGIITLIGIVLFAKKHGKNGSEYFTIAGTLFVYAFFAYLLLSPVIKFFISVM